MRLYISSMIHNFKKKKKIRVSFSETWVNDAQESAGESESGDYENDDLRDLDGLPSG